MICASKRLTDVVFHVAVAPWPAAWMISWPILNCNWPCRIFPDKSYVEITQVQGVGVKKYGSQHMAQSKTHEETVDEQVYLDKPVQ